MSHDLNSSGFETPFALMSVGIPGSGKSTFLQANAEKLGAVYLNTDIIRGELTGDEGDQSVNSQAWQLLYDRASGALYEGESVIIDATHLNPEQRMKGIRLYRKVGAQAVIGLVFVVSFGVAWERVQARKRTIPYPAMRRMHNTFLKHPPTLDEGFDKLMWIDTILPTKHPM